MSIERNGRDVTAEIMAGAARNAALERRRKPWARAIPDLVAAREELKRCPRPWMNDCICDSIDKIEAIIEELERP
jgi:hypothetical protein